LFVATAVNAQTQIQSDSWILKTPFAIPHEGGGIWVTAAAVNKEIYCIGGYQTEDGTYVGLTLVYDPTNDNWAMKTPMPTPRKDVSVV
jgi:hypothetical protein